MDPGGRSTIWLPGHSRGAGLGSRLRSTEAQVQILRPGLRGQCAARRWSCRRVAHGAVGDGEVASGTRMAVAADRVGAPRHPVVLAARDRRVCEVDVGPRRRSVAVRAVRRPGVGDDKPVARLAGAGRSVEDQRRVAPDAGRRPCVCRAENDRQGVDDGLGRRPARRRMANLALGLVAVVYAVAVHTARPLDVRVQVARVALVAGGRRVHADEHEDRGVLERRGNERRRRVT